MECVKDSEAIIIIAKDYDIEVSCELWFNETNPKSGTINYFLKFIMISFGFIPLAKQ